MRWERPELAPEEPLVPDSVQKFLAGMSHNEEPDLKLSPAADQAMAKLVELFSDPTISSKAQFRCSVEGPTEVDVLFESIIDEQFGYDPNSEWQTVGPTSLSPRTYFNNSQ